MLKNIHPLAASLITVLSFTVVALVFNSLDNARSTAGTICLILMGLTTGLGFGFMIARASE